MDKSALVIRFVSCELRRYVIKACPAGESGNMCYSDTRYTRKLGLRFLPAEA